MDPESEGSSPEITRKRVVFPHPDGPRKQTREPFSMVRETLSRALIRPKDFEIF
jgi:hypothetical protein